MGLAQEREVIQGSRSSLRPGTDMVDVASPRWYLAARVGAGDVTGAYSVSQRCRWSVAPTSDVQNSAADRVRQKTPPGASCSQSDRHCRGDRSAVPTDAQYRARCALCAPRAPHVPCAPCILGAPWATQSLYIPYIPRILRNPRALRTVGRVVLQGLQTLEPGKSVHRYGDVHTDLQPSGKGNPVHTRGSPPRTGAGDESAQGGHQSIQRHSVRKHPRRVRASGDTALFTAAAAMAGRRAFSITTGTVMTSRRAFLTSTDTAITGRHASSTITGAVMTSRRTIFTVAEDVEPALTPTRRGAPWLGTLPSSLVLPTAQEVETHAH